MAENILKQNFSAQAQKVIEFLMSLSYGIAQIGRMKREE